MSMSRLWRRIAIIRTTLLRDPGGKTRSRRLNRRSLRRPNPWRASKGSGRRNPGRESSRGAVISGSEFRDEGTAQHAADCHERGGLGAALTAGPRRRRHGGVGHASQLSRSFFTEVPRNKHDEEFDSGRLGSRANKAKVESPMPVRCPEAHIASRAWLGRGR